MSEPGSKAGASPKDASEGTLREFSESLIAWQRREGRHDLPWQGSRDAYRVWVSEVMLQQTQVAAVIGYYQRFLAAFPTVEALAAASLERVLALWSGLGYYSRARNLHACARRVVADFSGVFPSAPEILETLPGIGRSTASAIAVFSAGIRAPILDGNVKRVLSRSFGIEGYPGEKAVHDRLWQLAERLLPASQIEAYTQGLMDFGATVCTPRKPRCEVCFFKHRCVAFGQGRIDELPARKAARHYPERHVVMLVLHHTGAVLLQKRPAPGIWGGLWCLPEWPKDTGGAAALAFARDHGRIASVATLASFAHGFTHFRLWVEVLAVDLAAPLRSGTNPGELWLDLADASGAALPAPIKRLLLGLLRASPLHAGEVLKT